MLEFLETIGSWMRAIPGPTDEWVRLISNIIWPITLLLVLRLYRSQIRDLIDVLIRRLRTDDFEAFGVRLSKGSDIITLDREVASRNASEYAPDDVERIEELFEFVADHWAELQRWLDEWFEAPPSQEDAIRNMLMIAWLLTKRYWTKTMTKKLPRKKIFTHVSPKAVQGIRKVYENSGAEVQAFAGMDGESTVIVSLPEKNANQRSSVVRKNSSGPIAGERPVAAG